VTLLRSFGIVGLQAARYPVARAVWYRRYWRYLRLLTVFFYCYDIPRYIATLAYWYRHVSIDDKYRGIAGIVQHYLTLDVSDDYRNRSVSCKKKAMLSQRWALYKWIEWAVVEIWPFEIIQDGGLPPTGIKLT